MNLVEQFKDDLFFEDFKYYIRKQAGVEVVEDIEIEERIKERLKPLKDESNIKKSHFVKVFDSFVAFIWVASDDGLVFPDPIKSLSRHPEFVESCLEAFEILRNPAQQDNACSKHKSLEYTHRSCRRY